MPRNTEASSRAVSGHANVPVNRSSGASVRKGWIPSCRASQCEIHRHAHGISAATGQRFADAGEIGGGEFDIDGRDLPRRELQEPLVRAMRKPPRESGRVGCGPSTFVSAATNSLQAARPRMSNRRPRRKKSRS